MRDDTKSFEDFDQFLCSNTPPASEANRDSVLVDVPYIRQRQAC